MSDEINPGHEGMRAAMRLIGPAIAGVGLLFLVIGLVSFFSAFGGGEFPRLFWCAFVGMPILFVGVTITKFAFLGAAARYVAGETAPVGKDVTNYMATGTRDSIRDVTTAVGEGFAAAEREGAVRSIPCGKCGSENERSANFCHSCGSPVGAKKRCAKCGDLNDADARFCDKCGAPAG
jgi:membrane protease subunit (stomatin/prohibitin family)